MVSGDELFFLCKWTKLASFVNGIEEPREHSNNDKPSHLFDTSVQIESEKVLTTSELLLGYDLFLLFLSFATANDDACKAAASCAAPVNVFIIKYDSWREHHHRHHVVDRGNDSCINAKSSNG